MIDPSSVRSRLALLGALAIALSACSSAASPAASGGGGSGATKVEVFSWWTTGGEAAGLKLLIDIFLQADRFDFCDIAGPCAKSQTIQNMKYLLFLGQRL